MATDYEIQEVPQWWEVQNIPVALIRELRRRKNSNNIGMNFPTPGNPSAVTYDFFNNHSKYKGPMTPWVRIFSNGTGLASNGLVPRSELLDPYGDNAEYDGFVMMRGEGFYDAFGYKQNGNILKQDQAIIGYEANGKPHSISNTFRNQYSYKWPSTILKGGKIQDAGQKTEVPAFLPPPNIESVEIRTSKDLLAFGSFKFKCYSLAQLEYLSPFFLTPRVNVFIEIGWNLFNADSLIDLGNKQECWNIIQTPQKVVDRWYKSYGNYGCITGIITKYNFTTQDGMIYDCNVELTSRQALFAGMPAENNVSTAMSTVKTKDGKSVPRETKEYTGLKTFIKTAFPKIKQAVEQRKNFMQYVVETANGTVPLDSYEGEIIQHVSNGQNFYNNKPENRIFIGRSNDPKVYKKPSVPDGNDKISYSSPKGYDVMSFIDSSMDFDRTNNDDVWIQMDFLFEVVNKFCSVEKNKTFTINVDKVINAHPNLVSCDPNVIIPNGIAPKFNIGKVSTNQSNLSNTVKDGIISQDEANDLVQIGGYLPQESGDENKNQFLKSKYYSEITNTSDPIFKSATKVQTVFKTAGTYRDNLDTLVNRLYYDIGNLSETNQNDNISFPFIYDKEVEILGEELMLTDPKTTRPEKVRRTYQKYRFGNLKNIYINSKKVMEISENKEIVTLQQFANAILNTINDAVNGFWKFQISQNDSGGLAVLDNNNANLGEKSPNLNKVYVFDVGGTESCIRSISMDTSLTSEQATLTLFQAGQNKPIDSKTSMSARNASIPAISYIDRLEKFNPNDDGTGESNDVPSKSEVTVDQNPLIAKIQTYGQNDQILTMTQAYVQGNEDPIKSEKNYVQLNLPTDLKDKLTQILDDGDTENNLPLYSGISPNFTLTVTFDGLFGFRMFQHFGISNLPKPYVPSNVIFMITEVAHHVTQGGGKWETVVTCLARCVADQNIELIPV